MQKAVRAKVAQIWSARMSMVHESMNELAVVADDWPALDLALFC
jgi:hypothetical protein